MIGNKRYYPTPEKQERTTLNIRKTGFIRFFKKTVP